MRSAVCIHPIKVNRIIKEFLKEVVILPVDIEIDYDNDSSVNYAVCGDLSDDVDDNDIIVYVPNWKKADYKHDKGGKYFRQDFVKRCPLAKGFSDVTISLLHEIGHTYTKVYLPDDYSREKEYSALDAITDATERCFAYFKMLDEVLATDWAIEWLQDTDNRKLAKAFEKKFWSCFE